MPHFPTDSLVVNRRRFLTALGMGTGALAMGSRVALGDSSVPKRLIVLSTSHGTVYDGWKMRPGLSLIHI